MGSCRLKLFNTITRRKSVFRPIRKGKVGMYSCGPTVYAHAHIGNLRAYIVSDILKRTLIHDSYSVKHVMNITDVGHLVGDGSIGEDKLKMTARLTRMSPKEVARHFESLFLKDIRALNILEPDVVARATEHIPQMLKIAYALDSKGYLYKTDTGMYFDTSKFPSYGKLAGMGFKRLNMSLIGGARVERPEGTKNITDFAVWRLSKPDESEMVWPSRFGRGFPGWHIECSAISMEYLGKHFDIHTGGVDHIPIHHQNEIAQSESYSGEKFVNYWVHNEFIKVNGQKMSKSLRNIYTLDDLAERGFAPLDFRYFAISGHYRSIINFTFEGLANSKNTLDSIRSTTSKLSSILDSKGSEAERRGDPEFQKNMLKERNEFFKAVNNDMGLPEALTHLHSIIKESRRRLGRGEIGRTDAETVRDIIIEIDSILGLELWRPKAEREVSKEIMELVERREQARATKRFKDSDSIRIELRDRYGVIVEDTSNGPEIHFINED